MENTAFIDNSLSLDESFEERYQNTTSLAHLFFPSIADILTKPKLKS